MTVLVLGASSQIGRLLMLKVTPDWTCSSPDARSKTEVAGM